MTQATPVQMMKKKAMEYVNVGPVTWDKEFKPYLTTIKMGKSIYYLREDIDQLVTERFEQAKQSSTVIPMRRKITLDSDKDQFQAAIKKATSNG